jgi:antitoxin component YwqK of YwqJK toxin-antitoxin module
MKMFLILCFSLVTCLAFSQQKVSYYDFRWKLTQPERARYYAVTEKIDSLWSRKDYYVNEKSLQMEGTFKDEACEVEHGFFHYFHSNGQLLSKGNYVNGKRNGLWLSFHSNSMLYDSATYNMGTIVGTRQRWYRSGFPMDSSVFSTHGSGVLVGWFDEGLPSHGGLFSKGMKQTGKWTYFHKNGQISALEVFKDGSLVSREYFSEDGKPVSDTTNRDRSAEFKNGLKGWQRYLGNNLYFPSQWKFTTAGETVVMVDWTVDEEGNIQNAEISGSFQRDFDRIALETIKKSPKWLPAIDHNRRVSDYKRQPITFRQD